MPRFLLRAARGWTPAGYSRRYSHRRSPLVASSACTVAAGAMAYITPRYTRGVDSCVPTARPRDHTIRSCATLLLLICLSGLKRCSSYVRLMCNQSAASGCASIVGVTGTKPSVCAVGWIDIAQSAAIVAATIFEEVFMVLPLRCDAR